MAVARVAVVGAGPAGLCALRRLLVDHPSSFDPVVFERNDSIGGVWLYTEDTEKVPLHSAVYRSMRTNLPKEIMLYEGYPFPDDLPSFVHHSDFLKYLESFVNHFDLKKYINFNTEVVEVVPKPDSSSLLDGTAWEVTTKNLLTSTERKERFDAVIICNGHYTIPRQDLNGLENFKGTVIHSQKYRNPKGFRRQKVLILGSASSGIDISIEIASVADRVFLSQGRKKLSSTVAIPDNLGLIGRTCCVQEDGSVLLDDGSTLQVDAIVLCMGYHYNCPFLSRECGVSIEDHRMLNLYRHLFNIRCPSMVFIGLNFEVVPVLNFEMQMKLVSAVFSGSVQLPAKEDMIEFEEKYYKTVINNGQLPKDFHRLGHQQWQYNRDLAELGKFKAQEQIIEDIFMCLRPIRLNEPMTFRDYKIDIVDRAKSIFNLT